MTIDLGKTAAFAGVLIIGAGLAFGAMTLRDRPEPAPITIVPPAPTSTQPATETPSPIQVFVSGEVKAPDVYALAPTSRIKQLVEAAGGFTEMANKDVINLAQPLADGVHVHIPAVNETPPPLQTELSNPVPLRNSGELDIGIGGGLVNINTAVLEDLDTLPGIGPVTAQKILDYRAVNGPFFNIEAIMAVSGIGEGKFEKIRELITVGN